MDIFEAMHERHSVRKFTEKPLDQGAVTKLQAEINNINAREKLNFQLLVDEPEAFQAGKPSYGAFSGCRNYLALIGPRGQEEKVGYWGERLVLMAQMLNINSCWVALTYKKSKRQGTILPGEKAYPLIALGYGQTQGVPHKSKDITKISDYKSSDPAWYRKGLEAALLAPTSLNQQNFKFTRQGDKVVAKAGILPNSRLDLGIVKYHFELGSQRGPEVWG
ncbi:MAG: nitroreductase family protein [Atopobiaceae bacterium]|jgi:nitroreductase